MRPVRRREGLQRPGRDERRRDEDFARSRRRGVGGDTRTRHSEAFECKGARTNYFLVLRWGALGGGNVQLGLSAILEIWTCRWRASHIRGTRSRSSTRRTRATASKGRS